MMPKTIKILTYFLVFFLIASFVILCSRPKRILIIEKRKKASQVNTSQLGRNRYYFLTRISEEAQQILQEEVTADFSNHRHIKTNPSYASIIPVAILLKHPHDSPI